MKRTTFNSGTGQFVILEPQNGRSVKMSSTRLKPVVSSHYIRPGEKNRIITKVEYKDVPSFEVGKQITLGKHQFRIDNIEQNGSVFFLNASKLTKTSYFLLPCLGENRNYFLWDSLFVNAFIDVENEEYRHNQECIYLLYRFSGKPKFSEFEQKIQRNEYFVQMNDVDEYHTLYTFVIPDELKTEYRLFKRGAYSKLHIKYREQILAFHHAQKGKTLDQILKRSNDLRLKLQKQIDEEIPKYAELHDYPIIEEETYLNKFKIQKLIKPNVEFE